MAYNYEYPYTDPERSNADWLLNAVKTIKTDIDSLDGWKESHEKQYEELKHFYDLLVQGVFPPAMESALVEWIRINGIDIIGQMATSVFFGLTDSGYFVAYIPETWHSIIFKTTGLDIQIADIDHGHLVLEY